MCARCGVESCRWRHEPLQATRAGHLVWAAPCLVTLMNAEVLLVVDDHARAGVSRDLEPRPAPVLLILQVPRIAP